MHTYLNTCLWKANRTDIATCHLSPSLQFSAASRASQLESDPKDWITQSLNDILPDHHPRDPELCCHPRTDAVRWASYFSDDCLEFLQYWESLAQAVHAESGWHWQWQSLQGNLKSDSPSLLSALAKLEVQSGHLSILCRWWWEWGWGWIYLPEAGQTTAFFQLNALWRFNFWGYDLMDEAPRCLIKSELHSTTICLPDGNLSFSLSMVWWRRGTAQKTPMKARESDHKMSCQGVKVTGGSRRL